MYINFQQNRVCKSVKTVHTNLHVQKKRNEIKAKIDTFTHNEIMEASSTKSKVKHPIDNEGYKKGIQPKFPMPH